MYILRNGDNGDGLHNRQYTFWRPRGRWTSSHYTKHTLSFPVLGLTHSVQAFTDPRTVCGSSHTLAELASIHTTCMVSHALLQSIHGCMQCVWFIMTGYPFMSSHLLPTLLWPELLHQKIVNRSGSHTQTILTLR